jgi:hypothetical protein
MHLLRTSHPPKAQTVNVSRVLGGYGQTIPLLRALVRPGPLDDDGKAAVTQLGPALRRVKGLATSAGLPACRPPGV